MRANLARGTTLHAAAFVMALFTLTLGLAAARSGGKNTATTFVLQPAGDPGARITVTLTGFGDTTEVAIDASGLHPGAIYQTQLHAGTCDQPSASFTALPSIEANTSGEALVSGLVQFRAESDIPLVQIADREHAIAVTQDTRVVACGVVPALTGTGAGGELAHTR